MIIKSRNNKSYNDNYNNKNKNKEKKRNKRFTSYPKMCAKPSEALESLG